MRLSLAEVVGIHRARGLPALNTKVDGIVDMIVREQDTGRVVQHLHQKNMVTEAFRQYWFTLSSMAGGNVGIWLSELSDTWNAFRTLERFYLLGTVFQTTSLTTTPSTLTWLYQTTFSAPSGTRTINSIGLGRSTTAPTGNAKVVSGIMAATILGTPIVQTNTQTLEVNYRLLLSRT